MRKPHQRFRRNFRAAHENQCEVCGSLQNYRRGEPVPINMDMAHLVARSELERFGQYGRAFNHDEANFALLCQKCHAALDCWLGVMGKSSKSKITQRFEHYRERFLPLLHRRHRLLVTLISLTAEDPRPDASYAVKGGSLLSPIVGTPTEAVTFAPGQPDVTTSEQTPARGSCHQPVEGSEGFSCRPEGAEELARVRE